MFNLKPLLMKNLVIILGVILLFYSCEKNDKPVQENDLTSDYLPMAVGNYWVYEIQDFDTLGHAFPQISYDSILISNDTLIHSIKYYRFDNFHINSANTYLAETIFCQDSSRNLISSTGQLLFSEYNFTDTLLKKVEFFEDDTIFTVTYKMEKLNTDFSVPVGSFNDLLNVKGTVICNPQFIRLKNPRYTNKYYAKETGVIFQEQIWLGSGSTREKKLVRYHIVKE